MTCDAITHALPHKSAMSVETGSMNGNGEVPFEEDVRRGTADPGLKHLRRITLSPEEEAGYASKCKEWLPGTHDACCVQDFQAISDRAV